MIPGLGGLGDEEKKTTKPKAADELYSLALSLSRDEKPPFFPRAVNEFGYANTNKDNKIELRDELIKNENEQKDLAKTFETKDGDSSTELHVKFLQGAYKQLHELQAAHYNSWLRANEVNEEQFKKDQQAKIDECNVHLSELKKAADALPDEEKKKEALANIRAQQSRLNSLPKKINEDINNLIPKLQKQKYRNKERIYDAEVGGNNFADIHDLSQYVFVPYLDKKLNEGTVRKEPENKNAPLGLGGSVSATDLAVINEKKIRNDYRKAKELIKAEMERAEREPPHESLFAPFGVAEEDLSFAIRRFKKNGEWHFEPAMLGDHHVAAPHEYGMSKRLYDWFKGRDTGKYGNQTPVKVVFDSIMKFQKFAGCESEGIQLSYPQPAYGDINRRRRIHEIETLLDMCEKEKPKKSLSLDDNALHAVMREPNATKRREILDRISQLKANVAKEQSEKTSGVEVKEEMANKIQKAEERLQKINVNDSKSAEETDEKGNKKEIVNESFISKLFAEQKAPGPGQGILPARVLTALVEDIKRDDRQIDPQAPNKDAYTLAGEKLQKLNDVLKPILVDIEVEVDNAAGADGAKLGELVARRDEITADIIKAKKEMIQQAFHIEATRMYALYDNLKTIQNTIQDLIVKIQVASTNDLTDPTLKELNDKLLALQEKEEKVHAELLDRCADWQALTLDKVQAEVNDPEVEGLVLGSVELDALAALQDKLNDIEGLSECKLDDKGNLVNQDDEIVFENGPGYEIEEGNVRGTYHIQPVGFYEGFLNQIQNFQNKLNNMNLSPDNKAIQDRRDELAKATTAEQINIRGLGR